jgi:hypothetical protein
MAEEKRDGKVGYHFKALLEESLAIEERDDGQLHLDPAMTIDGN